MSTVAVPLCEKLSRVAAGHVATLVYCKEALLDTRILWMGAKHNDSQNLQAGLESVLKYILT